LIVAQLVRKFSAFVLLWNPKVYYRVDKGPPLYPIESQMNPVYKSTRYFSNIHFSASSHVCPSRKIRREDLGIHGSIILKWNSVEGCGLDSSGSIQGPVASSCEHCNKSSGSIKGGEFLVQMSVY
jgi:hypothetical protein